jgi:hypothetical protein
MITYTATTRFSKERMSHLLWILPLLFGLVGLVAGIAAWRTRSRRTNRLQLRLLAGRRRLLGEEITSRCEHLEEAYAGAIEQERLAAAATIDGLQMRLLDREAHLQNLQDLAHLQRHKLTILDHRRSDLVAAAAAGDPAPADAGPAPAREPGILERREGLEDGLLDSIQKRSAPPRSRRRRR